MSNIINLFCLNLLFIIQISAQGILTVDPNMFFEEFSNVDLSFNAASFGMDASLNNSGDSSLFIRWEVVMNSTCPTEWGVGMSDELISYLPNVLESPNQITLEAGESNSPMNANVYPFQTPGCCEFKVYISDWNDSSIVYDSIQYEIQINDSECLTTSTNEFKAPITFNVFPNPSSNFLNIEPGLTFNQVFIINPIGQKAAFKTDYNKINISTLNKGIHELQLYQSGRIIGRSSFIKID